MGKAFLAYHVLRMRHGLRAVWELVGEFADSSLFLMDICFTTRIFSD